MVKTLIGRHFGQLHVVAFSHKHKGHSFWKCVCTCGSDHVTENNRLRTGKVKSCGCKRRTHAHQLNQQRRANPIDIGWTTHENTYKHSRSAKTLGYHLTPDEFRTVCSAACSYCGQLPSLVVIGAYEQAKRFAIKRGYAFDETFYQQTKINVNGIDRIDSTRGYELTNVTSCCTTCNRAKSTTPRDIFYEWIKRVHQHLALK